MFFELYPGGVQPAERVEERSPLRFAWSDVEPRLRAAAIDPSGRDGRKLVLETPSLRTIRLAMLALDAGTVTAARQTTATNIYSVVAGSGTTTVDGVALDWQRGDVFVAPAWRPHVHRADAEAVLFCVSDEPLLEAIGMLREAVS
jgi:gentisate 1,2-dioxygenase